MKRIEDLTITEIKQLNHEHFVVYAQSKGDLSDVKPGQFVNVDVPDSKTTFLRRPISVHDVRTSDNSIGFFIKIVGCGTQHLSKLEVGASLNVLYPLGNGFDFKVSEKPLLVGGGCGVAPLLYLAKKMVKNGAHPTILFGARNADGIHLLDEFKKLGTVDIITDDGSLGEKGLITAHSIFNRIGEYDKVFVCGPEPMMKAVAQKAVAAGIECEVSLENTMACGIGACLCCVTDTKEGHKCVCTEGPVFNVNQLKWQI
jgi:dihydroorotate dehydrogenase electron transfer subunit